MKTKRGYWSYLNERFGELFQRIQHWIQKKGTNSTDGAVALDHIWVLDGVGALDGVEALDGIGEVAAVSCWCIS